MKTSRPKQDGLQDDLDEAVEAMRAEQAAFRQRMAAVGGSKDHASNVDVFTRTVSAMWLAGGGSPDRPALDRLAKVTEAAMTAFQPRDAVEGMLVGQAVALHSAGMEALNRATTPNRSDGDVARLWTEGANLTRGMVDMVDALRRWRGGSPKGTERDEQ